VKYTPATIAKAITSGVTTAIATAAASAGGTDLSALTGPQWIGVLGAGLVAFGAVFATPNKNHQPAPEPVSPADQIINALPAVVGDVAHAHSEFDRVKQAASNALGDALGTAPALGPLAQQAINSVLPRA
jgi:hypothetical protein